MWLLVRRDDVAAGIDESVNWIPALGVELDLRVDGFAALMLMLVAGIGVLVVGVLGALLRPATDASHRTARRSSAAR